MSIYTYVVDHGNKSPSVGLKTKVNGDRVIIVALGDRLEKLEEMEEFLNKLREETTCDQTKYAIDDYIF